MRISAAVFSYVQVKSSHIIQDFSKDSLHEGIKYRNTLIWNLLQLHLYLLSIYIIPISPCTSIYQAQFVWNFLANLLPPAYKTPIPKYIQTLYRLIVK